MKLFCAEKSKMKDVKQIGARRGPLRRGCVLLDRKGESKRDDLQCASCTMIHNLRRKQMVVMRNN